MTFRAKIILLMFKYQPYWINATYIKRRRPDAAMQIVSETHTAPTQTIM